MIDAQGYPKLIDFGFAKYVPDKTYTLCGTPGYLPPEVVMTRGHDCSADRWSLGILIYEMITGTYAKMRNCCNSVVPATHTFAMTLMM
jgi:serine/threonine protein kinase